MEVGVRNNGMMLQFNMIKYKSLPLSLGSFEACLTSFIAALCYTTLCCSVIESETALSVQENDTSPIQSPLLEPYENPHNHLCMVDILSCICV